MLHESSVLAGIMEKLPSINKLGQEKLQLQRENVALKAENNQLKRLVKSLQEQLEIAQADLRLAQLKFQESSCPAVDVPVPKRRTVDRHPKPAESHQEEVEADISAEVDEDPLLDEILGDSFFDDMDDEAESHPATKQPPVRKKKLSLLPKKMEISEVLASIERMESSAEIPALISTLLCQQYPSVYNMKRFFTDCLNFAYGKLLTIRKTDPQVERIVVFIVTLSRRVSRSIYEHFMHNISRDTELKTTAMICDFDLD